MLGLLGSLVKHLASHQIDLKGCSLFCVMGLCIMYAGPRIVAVASVIRAVSVRS